MQVETSSIHVADDEAEVMTVDMKNIDVNLPTEKRLETIVENMEKKIEEEEKKKEEKEKKMEELRRKKKKALVNMTRIYEEIKRLKLELKESEDKTPTSSPDGDKVQRHKDEIKADIKIINSKKAQHLFTIKECAQLESELTILKRDIRGLKLECHSLKRKCLEQPGTDKKSKVSCVCHIDVSMLSSAITSP